MKSKRLFAIIAVVAMMMSLFAGLNVHADGDAIELVAEKVDNMLKINVIAKEAIVFGGLQLADHTTYDENVFTYESISSDVLEVTQGVYPMADQGNEMLVTVPAGTTFLTINYTINDNYVEGTEYTFVVNIDSAYSNEYIEYDWGGKEYTVKFKEAAEPAGDPIELVIYRDGDNIKIDIIANTEIVFGGLQLADHTTYDENVFTYESISSDVLEVTQGVYPMADQGNEALVTVPAGTTFLTINYTIDTAAFKAGTEYTFVVNIDSAYSNDYIEYDWGGKEYTLIYKEDAPATYQITWKVDGQEDVITTVNAGETPVYPNGTPTKAADAQYTYTFKAWDPEVVPAAADATYTATWETTVNEYNIKFVNYDGTVLQESAVAYGETPVYNGETPTKDPTNTTTYTFKGWDPQIVPVTGDATYTAQYEEAVRKYTITWVIDGKNETEEYEYNATPSHADPVKEGYNFIGWDPQIAPVTADATYTAKFEEKVYYTVTFVDGVTGETISTVTVESGAAATAPTAPTHEGYTFTGWDKEFSNVTENLTVTAQYTPKTYRLWLYFVDENNEFHSLQAGRYFDIPFGTEYDVAEYIPAEIDGWVFVNTDNPTSGTMPAANVEINAFYHELKAPVVAGEKAELRERETADGKSDIRFIFKVTFNDSCVNYKGELVGPTKDYYEVTGIAAVLNAGNSDLTVNGQNIWKMADDSFQYTVVLKSIPESAYDKTITATPNITYVMGNDSATVNGTPISASVNSVQNVD